MSVTITPLGTGGAFTKSLYHNNYVFSFYQTNLLIDAGTTLRYSLPESGFKETDITDVFITHLHSDHVGGLEEFLQKCYWRFDKEGSHIPYKPNLIVPRRLLMDMKYLLRAGLENEDRVFEDYFDNIKVIDEREDEVEFIGGYALTPIPTHDLHKPGMLSYGFKFLDQATGENIIFTGDIGLIENSDILEEYIDKYTKYIFQDCQFYLPRHHVHSGLEQIKSYYPKAWRSKIYLMHYGDDFENYRKSVEDLHMKFVIQRQVMKNII